MPTSSSIGGASVPTRSGPGNEQVTSCPAAVHVQSSGTAPPVPDTKVSPLGSGSVTITGPVASEGPALPTMSV